MQDSSTSMFSYAREMWALCSKPKASPLTLDQSPGLYIDLCVGFPFFNTLYTLSALTALTCADDTSAYNRGSNARLHKALHCMDANNYFHIIWDYLLKIPPPI